MQSRSASVESPLSGASLSPQRIALRTYDRGCGLRLVTSVRKLQRPLDRLKARVLAQGVKERVYFHVFQVRILLPHRHFKPVEGSGGVAALCADHGVEDCTLVTLRRPCLGEHGLRIRMPAELVVCNRQ